MTGQLGRDVPSADAPETPAPVAKAAVEPKPQSPLGRDAEPLDLSEPEPEVEPAPEPAAPAPDPELDEIRAAASNYRLIENDPELREALNKVLEGRKQSAGKRNGKGPSETDELREIVKQQNADIRTLGFFLEHKDILEQPALKESMKELIGKGMSLQDSYEVAKRMNKATAGREPTKTSRFVRSETSTNGSRVSTKPGSSRWNQKGDAAQRASDSFEHYWRAAKEEHSAQQD